MNSVLIQNIGNAKHDELYRFIRKCVACLQDINRNIVDFHIEVGSNGVRVGYITCIQQKIAEFVQESIDGKVLSNLVIHATLFEIVPESFGELLNLPQSGEEITNSRQAEKFKPRNPQIPQQQPRITPYIYTNENKTNYQAPAYAQVEQKESYQQPQYVQPSFQKPKEVESEMVVKEIEKVQPEVDVRSRRREYDKGAERDSERYHMRHRHHRRHRHKNTYSSESGYKSDDGGKYSSDNFEKLKNAREPEVKIDESGMGSYDRSQGPLGSYSAEIDKTSSGNEGRRHRHHHSSSRHRSHQDHNDRKRRH